MADTRAYLRDGAAIYARSFAIIRQEADLARFSDAEATIAVRMIHACGLVEAARAIEFGADFVNASRVALAHGAPILCDAEMVAHGITRRFLSAKNDVICTLNDARVLELADELDTTRSAAALELWGERLAGAVVAIGNAPTALFHLLDMLDRGAPRPAAILGIPVGFVGAAELKEALAGNAQKIPFLIVRGRSWRQCHDGGCHQRACAGKRMKAGAPVGRLIGVGVGPGDPELITMKAVRLLKTADVIVHFAKNGAAGNARTIAAGYLRDGVTELALHYPLTTEVDKDCAAYRDAMSTFYNTSAAAVAGHLDAGRTVAVICEGDPLFYGSFMHLHVRLSTRYPSEVIAGVTGMSGAWSAAATPIAQGDDVFVVVPATLPEAELERRLADADAAVIMKIGRHLPKVRAALTRCERLSRAIYVERATMGNAVMMPLAKKPDDVAPYFAIVLVPGWEHAP